MPETDEVLTPETPVEGAAPPSGPGLDSGSRPPHWYEHRRVRMAAACALVLLGAGLAVFSYFYFKYARLIDAKLKAGPFSHTVSIYATPETLAVGDPLTPEALVSRLRQAGYGISRANPKGWYNIRPGAVEIFPGPESYFAREEPGVVKFSDGKIAEIISLQDHTERQEVRVEPLLITNVSDRNREKRRMVRFSEIPPSLLHAVISVEDKHFFRHRGFDLFRIFKAAYVDLREGRKEQGASTLSMQLARSLWLQPDKSFRRKAAELLITLHLEARLSKQQIFEYYANEVYLGRRGTYNINGFGEGARTFFGKEIGRLTVPEAATLAGMVQRPSYFNPFRYPDRARERRNLVLSLMRQNGYLSDAHYHQAIESPLVLAPDGAADTEVDAQYFIDRVNDDLQNRFGDREDRAGAVYTTLDSRLQHAAHEAVRIGMANVDKLLVRRSKKTREQIPPGQPQVALVALDPHTGEVKAMVGGRNYGASQFDHVLASRQPGSVFKPFVYAAALNTAVQGGPKIFTPASIVVDEPTTFQFANQVYEPDNFGHSFMGPVTLRSALARSLNVGTVKLAEMVGYGNVAAMARRCGLGANVQPTPALALGAYEATPLEIAGSYTVFANGGNYVAPTLLSLVRSHNGAVLYRNRVAPRPALDPRVAYLMVNMMEEVIRSGTGAGVRARGFRPPAAGKTGTSRDGWFAGFTSELLCVVWVGFDDNRDLDLEGSKAALPIWTEFMKRAHELRAYRDAKPFRAPAGIVRAEICPESGQLESAFCPSARLEVFIDGTQPVAECEMHGMQNYAAGQGLGPWESMTVDSAALPARQ